MTTTHHRGTGKTKQKKPHPDTVPGLEAADEEPHPSSHPPKRRFNPLPWAVCLFLAFAHTAAAARVSTYGGGEGDTLAVLILPAVFTAICIPQARRHGWLRWASMLALSYIVLPEFAAATVAVAETWILHRFWVVEYPDNHASRWVKNRLANWKTPKEATS